MKATAGHPSESRIEYCVGSAIDCPVASGSADSVFAFDSLDHWPDRVEGLREVRRVLRGDGRLAIVKDRGVPGARDAREALSDALARAGLVVESDEDLAEADVRFTLWVCVSAPAPGGGPRMKADLPLTAQLSQVLVAFTVEFDSEFERRMRDLGHPGFMSFAGWRNVLRYVPPKGITVRELRRTLPVLSHYVPWTLGCVERWGCIHILPAGTARPSRSPRDGYGSTRGITSESLVTPTRRTMIAVGVWPQLLRDIEARWQQRFGAATETLRATLGRLVRSFDGLPPEGLPDRAMRRWATGSLFGPEDDWTTTPRGDDEPDALPVLLARALWTYAVQFDRAAPMPIPIAANLLRVLDETGTPRAELAGLTGIDATGPSPALRRSGLIEFAPRTDGGRGKLLRLTPAGLAAKRACTEQVRTTEGQWVERYGRRTIEGISDAVAAVRDHGAFPDGLTPPPGVPRSGAYTPGFDVGPPGVMRKRVRDMRRQTMAFVGDPRRMLPHWPQWDGNRGYGP